MLRGAVWIVLAVLVLLEPGRGVDAHQRVVHETQNVHRPAFPIGVQAHSWNDLDEWQQGLTKGVTWFKIDPHYMPASFCTSQGRAEQDRRGCLVLTHDLPVSTRQYNTTDDLLHLLGDPAFESAFRAKEKVFIALCFKGIVNPCNHTDPHAQPWISLVDDFFSNAVDYVEENMLNVEFIIDGVGTPGIGRDCLRQRWRPWVSVWVSNRDPAGALTSDNTTLGFDRFRVLNEPEGPYDAPDYYVKEVAQRMFGKFAAGAYPYLVWEPSNQSEILTIADAFQHSPDHEHPLPPHPQGLRFSANIDPVMLQVFLAPRTKSGARNMGLLQEAEEARIVAFSDAPFFIRDEPTANGTGTGFFAVVAFTRAGDTTSQFRVFHSRNLSSPLVHMNRFSQPANTLGRVTSLSTLWFRDAQYILASDDAAFFALFTFNARGVLHTVATGQFGVASHSSQKPATTALSQHDKVLLAVQGRQTAECPMELQLWSLSSENATGATVWGPEPRGSPQCLLEDRRVPVDAMSLAVLPIDEADDLDICSDYEDLMPSAVAFSTTEKIIYGATLCVNAVSGEFMVAVEPTAVDVGSRPQISMAAINGTTHVLEVHGEGYCFNSVSHNTRATPSVCAAVPRSTPYVLSYNYGMFQSWHDHLEEARPMSSCDEAILHGAYDRGSLPHTTLFSVRYESGCSDLAMLEVHRGVSAGTVDHGECGMPLPFRGVVADSWPLPHLQRVVEYVAQKIIQAEHERTRHALSIYWGIFVGFVFVVCCVFAILFLPGIVRRMHSSIKRKFSAGYSAIPTDEQERVRDY